PALPRKRGRIYRFTLPRLRGRVGWGLRAFHRQPPRAEQSADRWCVLHTSLVPQRIEAAGDFERRPLADITLERFAVIPNLLDDPVDPILGQSELLAEISLSAEQPFYFRILGFHLLFEIFLTDVEFFGIEHCKVHPFDDVEPL